jgi:hypothetical protein
MTRLSERLKEVGIDDPGAEGDPIQYAELMAREAEADAEAATERAKRWAEQAARDRESFAREGAERRARAAARHREQQKRAGRVIAFYRDLGMGGIATGPQPCPSATCRARRRGVTVLPSFHVSLESGDFWCGDCNVRGTVAAAPGLFGRDAVPLLRRHGFDGQADVIDRRRAALGAINSKLEHLGRQDTRWGDLRTLRDGASSLEELEAVAEQASKMRRKAAAA